MALVAQAVHLKDDFTTIKMNVNGSPVQPYTAFLSSEEEQKISDEKSIQVNFGKEEEEA